MKDGEINSIREKVDRANAELGEAFKSRAVANGSLDQACSQLGKANQQLGETGKSLSGEIDKIAPAIGGNAFGSIAGLETQLRAEQGKLASVKTPLEKAIIQNRINELLAQLEKAKQQYQEEQKKQRGRGMFR